MRPFQVQSKALCIPEPTFAINLAYIERGLFAFRTFEGSLHA
jgi:hypothetical protein